MDCSLYISIFVFIVHSWKFLALFKMANVKSLLLLYERAPAQISRLAADLLYHIEIMALRSLRYYMLCALKLCPVYERISANCPKLIERMCVLFGY